MKRLTGPAVRRAHTTDPLHDQLRPDLGIAADLVPDGARVLDLGCAEGTLLRHLIDFHGCRGIGVEIDPTQVIAALRRGVSVIELNIDSQLAEFADDSYDMVVLSRVLQATVGPAQVLAQMRRIAERCIVSVPNFGLWRHRWVLLRGRMPMSRVMPYSWFDTPNIHHATLPDLEDLFAQAGFAIENRVLFDESGAERGWPSPVANLMAASAVYRLRRS